MEATGRPASASALFDAVAVHRHHNETPSGQIPAIADKLAAARARLAERGVPSAGILADTASLDEILRVALDALARR